MDERPNEGSNAPRNPTAPPTPWLLNTIVALGGLFALSITAVGAVFAIMMVFGLGSLALQTVKPTQDIAAAHHEGEPTGGANVGSARADQALAGSREVEASEPSAPVTPTAEPAARKFEDLTGRELCSVVDTDEDTAEHTPRFVGPFEDDGFLPKDASPIRPATAAEARAALGEPCHNHPNIFVMNLKDVLPSWSRDDSDWYFVSEPTIVTTSQGPSAILGIAHRLTYFGNNKLIGAPIGATGRPNAPFAVLSEGPPSGYSTETQWGVIDIGRPDAVQLWIQESNMRLGTGMGGWSRSLIQVEPTRVRQIGNFLWNMSFSPGGCSLETDLKSFKYVGTDPVAVEFTWSVDGEIPRNGRMLKRHKVVSTTYTLTGERMQSPPYTLPEFQSCNWPYKQD